jgi:hypothetical protein
LASVGTTDPKTPVAGKYYNLKYDGDGKPERALSGRFKCTGVTQVIDDELCYEFVLPNHEDDEATCAYGFFPLRAIVIKIKCWDWKATDMATNLTMEELVELQQQVQNDPANKHPTRQRGGDTIWLYKKEAQRKLDAIAWAVTYKIEEKRRMANNPKMLYCIYDWYGKTPPVPGAVLHRFQTLEGPKDLYSIELLDTTDALRDFVKKHRVVQLKAPTAQFPYWSIIVTSLGGWSQR